MYTKRIHILITCLFWIMTLFTLSLGVSASANQTISFKDISSSYAREDILALSKAGIVLGDAQGYYHPKQAVTRAEFVAMLTRTWGLKSVNSQIPAYLDVPKSSWAYGSVQAAVTLGIANGTSAKTFSPNRTITRQEAATLLMRALKGELSQSAQVSLNDRYQVAAWALPYVQEAVHEKILVGYQGYFRPNAFLSREETAVLLNRLKTKMDQSQAKAKTPIILGWQYQSTTDEFIRVVKDSPINTLSPRWFYLQPDGTVVDYAEASLVQWAQQNGRQVWPLFGNRFDAKATNQALSSQANRTRIIQRLVELSDKYQLDGINIDFENILPGDRDAFTAFIKEMTDVLHAKGKKVSVDVPPDTQSDWSAAYDYANLGKYADYVVLMGYEEHWEGGSTAGSVSSLPWLNRISNQLLSRIPANKFIVGLPLYTRDWYKTNGTWQSQDLLVLESFQFLSQNRTSPTWDPGVSQYQASYQKNGASHQIWMEESRSLGAKMSASLHQPIAGFAYWYVGESLPEVWNVISNVYTLQKWKAL
ncbi:S-layer homology domain-containing protein [Brevibacillus ruminantium]|uniref:S-layer homology domain-containing protein n=1 Tax=Brevibacillus ruminantium TaxID=2950604 RepID=A0ABY4W8K0_9BACL|nr:S-layer homology domain-containing protein [Brevibacillus ruminantium]USG63378.1 S-layer homology domain-containing protein [Brevibacillus ruminantium]